LEHIDPYTSMDAKCDILVKKKLIMHECIHIFNDNDNGQDVKKGTRTFFVVWGWNVLSHFLIIYKKRIAISLLMNNVVNFETLFIHFQELV